MSVCVFVCLCLYGYHYMIEVGRCVLHVFTSKRQTSCIFVSVRVHARIYVYMDAV